MVDPLKIQESPERTRLLRMFPELGLVQRTIYIGASQWRALLLGDLLAAGQMVDILEPHPGNARYWLDRGLPVIQDALPDARLGQTYDIALCLHVLEHIPKSRLDECLRWLEWHADLAVIACPLDEERLMGRLQPGGVYAEDDLEAHLWSPTERDFAGRGWHTDVLNRSPHPVPEILAWKRS